MSRKHIKEGEKVEEEKKREEEVTHHKSWLTEAGVAMAWFVLDTHPLVAWLQQALINVILTAKACPTCQE